MIEPYLVNELRRINEPQQPPSPGDCDMSADSSDTQRVAGHVEIEMAAPELADFIMHRACEAGPQTVRMEAWRHAVLVLDLTGHHRGSEIFGMPIDQP